MSKRDEILEIAEGLILSRGYNAFSFADISQKLNIRNASIHYHFPSKTELGKALINKHILLTKKLFEEIKSSPPEEQLKAFFTIYEHRKVKNQVCMVGSLATDFFTVDETLQNELKMLANLVLEGLTCILKLGKEAGSFYFEEEPRTRALMIITNLLAALQVSRLTGDEDFDIIKKTVFQTITKE